MPGARWSGRRRPTTRWPPSSRRGPTGYAGFAAVALQDPEAAAHEAERAVRELGQRGVLVNGYSSVGDLETAAYYDEPRFEPFWGRPELLGPTWAFGVETATHALRLITSGLFDRFPRLTVILGHLGEGLRESFHITTSGNYHTPSLVGLLLELGADRVLFAADHPFEDLADGARWMDTVPIAEGDRLKIGRLNAARLLGL